MSYDVMISRQPISATFDLKGPHAALQEWLGRAFPALPMQINQQITCDGVCLCHIGPDHWLLRAGILREDALKSALMPDRAPSEISIVQISDSLVFFTIEGPEAEHIMSIACPLDLHSTRFDHAFTSFSTAFGVKTLISRMEHGFEIGVDTSYANMVVDYLERASLGAVQ